MHTDPIFYDTETIGFYGLAVLIQFSVGKGEIFLYNVFKERAGKTVELIKWMMEHEGGVVGFNLTFDHFHLCKLYTLLSMVDPDLYPEDAIYELADLEPFARDGVCLKPVKACDIMLHAQKGHYQSLMERKPVRIKRVPTGIAYQLANELEERVKLNPIYFARRKDQSRKQWTVEDVENDDGTIDPDFKNVTLRFAASKALKRLAADALGREVTLYSDVDIDADVNEKGWAPYAAANKDGDLWNGSWPVWANKFIMHWTYDKEAREYATDDVVITRDLYYHLGSPELGDVDSTLACMVATCRWRGFKVDMNELTKLRHSKVDLANSAPKDPGAVMRWLDPVLSEPEKAYMEGSTKKVFLEGLRDDSVDDCPTCDGEGGDCPDCLDGCVVSEAAKRAKAVLIARSAQKEIELYDKIIEAGRFHASFKIIGTLSGRMSGSDRLNPQGVKATKEVRRCFTLAWEGFELAGGDFESFEVVIAVAIYKDPKLEADLLTNLECPYCQGNCHCYHCKGRKCDECYGTGQCIECGNKGEIRKKIHGLFAEALYPEESYESIILTKGKDTTEDLYTQGKRGVFSQLYGGTEYTLQTRLGVSEDVALKASKRWKSKYPGIESAQMRILNAFQSMRQPNGIGTAVEWHDPQEYMESLLGFKRYFTLENMICKALFDMAEKPPKAWLKVKQRVRRREREQTSTGATRSALFGAAFALQSANVRAATNHEIQSTGAEITKDTQAALWELQPAGCHPFELMLLNVHDEIMAPMRKELKPKARAIIDARVQHYSDIIPMISIDWSDNLNSWADK